MPCISKETAILYDYRSIELLMIHTRQCIFPQKIQFCNNSYCIGASLSYTFYSETLFSFEAVHTHTNTHTRTRTCAHMHTLTHTPHSYTLTGGGLGMRPMLSPAATAPSLFTSCSGLNSGSFFFLSEESSLSSLEMTIHVGAEVCPTQGVTDLELVKEELWLEPERLFFPLTCIKMAMDHQNHTNMYFKYIARV